MPRLGLLEEVLLLLVVVFLLVATKIIRRGSPSLGSCIFIGCSSSCCFIDTRGRCGCGNTICISLGSSIARTSTVVVALLVVHVVRRSGEI